LIVDVNGVGYEIHVTLNCSRQLGKAGENILILTYLHVREDILQLFGFISKEERELFLQLISTSGIGPKKALAILSGTNVEDLQQYIVRENLTALTSLPGVGKRTAQRLIVELKDKLSPTIGMEFVESAELVREKRKLFDEAILALVSLGYNKNTSFTVVQKIIKENARLTNLEELIKQALRELS